MSPRKRQPSVSRPVRPSSASISVVPFETLTAFMTEGLFVFDTNGCVSFANVAARELFGLVPGQEGIPIAQLAQLRQVRYLDGTPVPTEHLPVLRALQGEVIQHYEHIRFNPTTGQEYFAEANVAPVRNSEGAIIGALLLLRDITAKKQAERQLEEVNQTLQALIQASPLAIISRDAQGQLTTWNPAAERIFGWTAAEVLGKPLITVPEERQGEYQQLLQKFRRGASVTGYESQRQRRDGSLVDVSIWGAPRYNADGTVGGVMALIDDITERKLLQQKIEQMATTDALTGLANRYHLLERLRREVAHARRQYEEFSLLMIDVDRFKSINDRFGHAAGDRVLKHIASVLRQALREIDLAARYGGEEFVVLLPATCGKDAVRVGERLRAALQRNPPRVPKGSAVAVTVSIGVAVYPTDADHHDDLLLQADASLYAAKGAGRDCIVWSGDQLQRSTAEV